MVLSRGYPFVVFNYLNVDINYHIALLLVFTPQTDVQTRDKMGTLLNALPTVQITFKVGVVKAGTLTQNKHFSVDTCKPVLRYIDDLKLLYGRHVFFICLMESSWDPDVKVGKKWIQLPILRALAVQNRESSLPVGSQTARGGDLVQHAYKTSTVLCEMRNVTSNKTNKKLTDSRWIEIDNNRSISFKHQRLEKHFT